MHTVFTYNVVPNLPDNLKPLLEIAYNIWWCWNHEAIALFRRIDRELWETTYQNPVLLLGRTNQQRLIELSKDDGFCAQLARVQNLLHNYMSQKAWYQEKYNYPDVKIAYFSMEFGLTGCLPIYSGGLGVLAGDSLKSASDLGLPLVGVGLAYQQGFFRQYLNIDGWQQESYPTNDFANLPMAPILKEDQTPLKVPIWFPHRTVMVQIWRIQVGRVPLFLLDTNCLENDPADCKISQTLYGGDQEMRIQQETVLGIGGIRALEAMNIIPTVCHMNEGHSAFMTLERIRQLKEKINIAYNEAREAIGSSNVFTSHTPVPAGFDIFSPALMDKYLRDYPGRLGLTMNEFQMLGRKDPNNQQEGFNMALLAGRHASYINAVSKLHAVVTRDMWKDQYPSIPKNEVPIYAITNGIHLRSWMSKEIIELLDTYLGDEWRQDQTGDTLWKRIEQIPDEELWRVHLRRRERLVGFVRRRLYEQLKRRGASQAELEEARETLNPNLLTIGFGRRFATYKRANLILRNPDRLRRLLLDERRPIQIIYAGKAHPKDMHGKELIKQIFHFAREANVRRRFVFLEDYDLNVARYMVQGVDIWLNNPRRPMEASGTSGMKAAANGALNLSVLDGWWDEAYNHEVGWAIGAGEEYEDISTQDHIEANALYNLLEKEIVPQFYNLSADRLPRDWLHMMKQALIQLCPVFNTNRMEQEYTEKFYLPASLRCREMAADDYQRARVLAAWKAKMWKNWKDVKIAAVDFNHKRVFQVGERLKVTAEVFLGSLTPRDVSVQVYFGPLDPEGNIISGETVAMHDGKKRETGNYLYECEVDCHASGRHGFAVRVVPYHADLVSPFDLALISWI